MPNVVDTLLLSPKVQMAFAKVKLYDSDAQKACIEEYVKSKATGVEEYIASHYISDTVIQAMLDHPSVPDVLVIQFNVDDHSLWPDIVCKMYERDIVLYERYYSGIGDWTYLNLFIDALRKFLASGNYIIPQSKEDIIVNELKSDAEILVTLASYGLISKAFTYRLLLKFNEQCGDKLTENNRAVLFRGWIADNLVFDEAVDKALSLPDTKGFLCKMCNITDGAVARDYVRKYFMDNTYIYQQIFDDRISDEEFELTFIKDFHRYVSSKKGK